MATCPPAKTASQGVVRYRRSVCDEVCGYDLPEGMIVCPESLWVEPNGAYETCGSAVPRGHAHVRGERLCCPIHLNAAAVATGSGSFNDTCARGTSDEGRTRSAAVVDAADAAGSLVFEGSSVAFGVFDGVHRGHRFLIDRAHESASETGGLCLALTFSIDPDEMFAPGRLVKLMSNEERIAALAAVDGVDVVAVLGFTREFASLSPEEFLDRIFGEGAPAHLHVGEGFRFGCRGAGDVALLEKWGGEHGVQVHSHDLLRIGNEPVSSTCIRKLLAQGALEEAESLLGRHSCRSERQ